MVILSWSYIESRTSSHKIFVQCYWEDYTKWNVRKSSAIRKKKIKRTKLGIISKYPYKIWNSHITSPQKSSLIPIILLSFPPPSAPCTQKKNSLTDTHTQNSDRTSFYFKWLSSPPIVVVHHWSSQRRGQHQPLSPF